MSELAAARKQPLFSIVVPTFDAEPHIERLLRSIRLQNQQDYSVTLVDHSSSDRTTEIGRSYGCSIVSLPKPSFYTPPGRSRNVGAKASPGSIFVHLDADMELSSPSFLEKLESLLDKDHQAAVIGEDDIAIGFLAGCKALERSCYRGTGMEGARAVTSELFAAVGGYDEEISSGEDQFITQLYRQRTLLVSDDSLVLKHHLGSYSLADLLRKKFSYGRTAKTYLRRARQVGAASAMSIAAMSASAYIRNWRKLTWQPLHYLCIFPLRTAEFTAVRIGMWFGSRNDAQREA